MIFRCQPGYETHLEREIRPLGHAMRDNGAGWLETNSVPSAKLNSEPGTRNSELSRASDLCFAHSILPDPQVISGQNFTDIGARIAGYFFETARTERFNAPWPLIFDHAAGPGLDGLGRRADAVQKAFAELFRPRMSRVAKLASPTLLPRAGLQRGLFVFFTDFNKAYVSRDLISGGQRRMADDPFAPSRSYLKVEEAYGILEREPAPNETVVDLGAAPGGWSYSAAKRGARVTAVDNGPLKAGALNNPLITHLQQDAFHFAPANPVDWLFSDLVEDPRHVLDNIVVPWLERRWCRRFIVNLKFGRVDPVALLKEVHTRIPPAKIRHLYHDREEFTLTGELAQLD